MHKHLKQPLVPPDHLNIALSAGISEIIEVAMAKSRDERYQSMADMLADLKQVQRGEAPSHARRQVNLDGLEHLGPSAATVDIEPPPPAPAASVWEHPAVISMLAGLALSVIANIILIVMMATR
jgi:serine/threonine-protein kinase